MPCGRLTLWAARKVGLRLLAMMSLTGCATVTPETIIVTPQLPAWSASDQAEVADELSACTDCDATVRAIGAYIGLRDAIRAAQARAAN